MKPITTVTELFNALGGDEAVAKLLGLQRASLNIMKKENSISRQHHHKLSHALPRPFETPDHLFRLVIGKRRPV